MAKNKARRENKKAKAKGEKKPEKLTEFLKLHIQRLGLRDTKAYKEWCRENGFRTTLNKKHRDLDQERLFVARSKADAVVKSHRKVRSAKRAIAAYLAGHEDARRAVPHEILTALRDYGEDGPKANHTHEHDATLRLIQHVNKHTDLLDGQQSPWLCVTYITGVLALARWHKEWIRPVEDWRPKTHNLRRRFGSLARHLFAKYDVPSFMDECWFVRNYSDERQLWFLHIGQGGSPRHCLQVTDDGCYPTTTINFTKKEAHYFMQAPATYSINHALRWGQIRAAGGDPRLAEALGETQLVNNWQHNEFWMSVFRFFIQHPMLDRRQLGPIVDYIRFQRFTPRREMVDRGVWEDRDPPQPNFSMQRRDPEALMRAVQDWHEGLGRSRRGGKMDWEPHVSIRPFELSMGEGKNHKVWQINELLSSDELKAEGSELGHCVSSYDNSCSAGRCSIWSMRCLGGSSGKKSRLTIEVANNCIRQARGRYNATATEQQRKILGQWAGQNGLNIGTYI